METSRRAESLLKSCLRMIPIRFRRKMLLKTLDFCAREYLATALTDSSGKEAEANTEEFFNRFVRAINENMAPSAIRNKGLHASLLRSLLKLDNELYKTISAVACSYDNGLHPKHRLMKYHDFFCKNVGPEETVLDIGCGNGFLTSDIAKCTSGRVVGIDMNKENIAFAKSHYCAKNIDFICGDVITDIAQAKFDVVVLSNVLEHLDKRAEFLKLAREKVSPLRFLLRVPMYEREWLVPMKEELGIDYMLDATHEIEYTQEQFFEELKAAGLVPEKWEIRWGEIWLRAVPN